MSANSRFAQRIVAAGYQENLPFYWPERGDNYALPDGQEMFTDIPTISIVVQHVTFRFLLRCPAVRYDALRHEPFGGPAAFAGEAMAWERFAYSNYDRLFRHGRPSDTLIQSEVAHYEGARFCYYTQTEEGGYDAHWAYISNYRVGFWGDAADAPCTISCNAEIGDTIVFNSGRHPSPFGTLRFNQRPRVDLEGFALRASQLAPAAEKRARVLEDVPSSAPVAGPSTARRGDHARPPKRRRKTSPSGQSRSRQVGGTLRPRPPKR